MTNATPLCTLLSAAGLPDGVLYALQRSHWETCVPLRLDGHDHGTKQVMHKQNRNKNAGIGSITDRDGAAPAALAHGQCGADIVTG